MEKRRRGRPRKSESISNTPDATFNSKESIESAIDRTQFDFYNPIEDGTPEVNSFNPLKEAPIQRDYATPKIQEGIVGDIEEPIFHQRSINQSPPTPNNSNSQSPPNMGGGGSMGGAPQSDFMQNPNPALNQLDDAEKRLASEQMVDAVLDTYETITSLGGHLGKVKEDTIKEKIASGKLDGNRRIPTDEYGNSVSIMEFVQGYNEQVVQAIKPDPSFRKKVRPPMIRVFAKRGWGMTDEQFLLFAFGKDLSVKAVTLFAMKKGVNDILKKIEEENVARKRQERRTPTPPAPAPEPVREEILTPEVEEVTDDEIRYMERMNVLMEERRKEAEAEAIKKRQEEEQGVTKMQIKFDDNPLREKPVREYPAPKVEETFIKGGEIKDDEQ